MHAGRGRGVAAMRGRTADKALRNSPLTAGQKDAVKLILYGKDRKVGVQGYARTGKTAMLNRARTLLEKRGFKVAGLAPSASAARTLENEAGVESETLQRFLARNAGVAEGRLTAMGERAMRAAFGNTVLVVDEGSLVSTVQARDLLQIANALRVLRVVLAGNERQRRRRRQALCAVATGRHEDSDDGRDHALARPRPEGGVRGQPRGRRAKGVRETRPQCCGSEGRQSRRRGRCLRLPASERGNAGLMASSHELRERINDVIRERLDSAIVGRAMEDRTTGLARLHAGGEGARRQLRTRR